MEQKATPSKIVVLGEGKTQLPSYPYSTIASLLISMMNSAIMLIQFD